MEWYTVTNLRDRVNNVVLVRDKLFIDGMIYCHDSKKQGKRVVLARDMLFIDGMIYCHESKKQGKHVV
jgi:hypothetical protein